MRAVGVRDACPLECRGRPARESHTTATASGERWSTGASYYPTEGLDANAIAILMMPAETSYDDIESAYGRRILGYREIIRARAPTPAETQAFAIGDRLPLIEVRRTSRTTGPPARLDLHVHRPFRSLRGRLPHPGMTEHSASAHPAAKNLEHEEPAPMDAKLAGYPWLPRMIDKARASKAGTLGTYYRYPCPIDAACLDLLGIDAGTFRTIASRAIDDQAVIEELATIGARVDQVVDFDPVQLNAELHRDGS